MIAVSIGGVCVRRAKRIDYLVGVCVGVSGGNGNDKY